MKKYLTRTVSIVLSALEKFLFFKCKEKKYYFIMSNARSGSTWLTLLLDPESGFEVKWTPVSYPLDSTVHIPIGFENLNFLKNKHFVRKDFKGTKMVFDPFSFLSKSVFIALGSYLRLNKNIRLIALYRNYYQLFLSWNCRGVQHNFVNTKLAISYINETKLSKIFIFNIPGFANNLTLDLYQNYDNAKIAMNYTEAIGKILILFYNDLMINQVMLMGRKRMFIDYSDIKEKFENIIEYCQFNWTKEQINEALKNPSVLKLSDLNDFVYPSEQLIQVAEVLNEKLKNVILRKQEINNILFLDEKSSEIIIRDDEMKKIFGDSIPLKLEPVTKQYFFHA